MTLPVSRKLEGGFTLVELAIVLMIIGLLIGGILRGQELMENARVTSTIQQTKAYDGALTTFRDQYSTLPGDMTNPGRLANCNTAPCNSDVGNGNSIIGTPFTSKTATTGTEATENLYFWRHLSLARLISGVNAASTTAAWGEQFPAAKIGGGFHVGYANIAAASATVPSVSGHVLILKNTANNGTLPVETTGNAAISPLRAAQIDRKMDDGLPLTGDVIGIGTTNCTGTAYSEAQEIKDCGLLIRVMN